MYVKYIKYAMSTTSNHDAIQTKFLRMLYLNDIARKLCLDRVLRADIDICIFVYSAHTPHIF